MKFRSLAAAAALAFAPAAYAQVKWDLPTAYPATNFHTENIQQFANDVEKASGGKLKIQVHAGASLFKAPEIKRAVQGGQAQAGELLWVNFENEDAMFGVDGVPFLATSYGDAGKLWKASRKALEDRLARQGMTILFSVPWPPQGLYNKKPVSSAADMKGVKFRSYSPATARIAELLGAQPVTIQAAEVPQALATGAMESMISSGATGYDSKIFEQVKYFYDTQAWLPKNAVIANRKALDALDAGTREAVMKAAAAAEPRGWKVSEEKTKWYLEQLTAKGMTIAKPSAQLAADLKKIGEQMTADWLKKTGADGQAVVAGYRKM
jgi:TRAP-type C4-dicarboxylate transport system substrate-binding protein